MDNNNLISIVIPCYNDARYIEQSVNSALQQTYPHIEVILVDDGSDELTKKVLKALEPKITKLITLDNQGQSTARNIGIKAANGDFILTLDSDDFFESTFCEKAVSLFENDADIKIVTSFIRRLLINGEKDIFKPIGGAIGNFLKHNCATGSAMFRKKDWERVAGYDQDMREGFEDWEFYIRLVKDGGFAYVIPEVLFNYRIKEISTTRKANKIKNKLLKYVYFKHIELYKDNFELLINHLLDKIEREEFEKIKNTHRLEFVIGKVLLSPLRWLKFLFRSLW